MMPDPLDPPCQSCGMRVHSDCTCSVLDQRELGRDQRLTRAELELRCGHDAEAQRVGRNEQESEPVYDRGSDLGSPGLL